MKRYTRATEARRRRAVEELVDYRKDNCHKIATNKEAALRAAGKCLILNAPGEIRTPGLLVRSQTLYPTELRAQLTINNT